MEPPVRTGAPGPATEGPRGTLMLELSMRRLRSLTGKLPKDYIAQPHLPTRNGGKNRT